LRTKEEGEVSEKIGGGTTSITRARLGRHRIARFFDCKCNGGFAIPLGSGTIQTNWLQKGDSG
jgi:hypothetical protein